MGRWIVTLLLLLWTTQASANHYGPDFSTVIADARRTAWTNLGLDGEGGIPNYSSVTCSTVSEGDSNNGPEINTCITNAANDTAVLIPAGEYPVTTSIVMKSRVVLRGSGAGTPFLPGACPAGQTCLAMNGNARITFSGGSKGANWSPGAGSQTNITAGYTKDSVSITLSSASGYAIGDYISIFEANDSALITPVENYLCEDNGASARCKQQYAKITGKAGNVLTIDRPIAFIGAGGSPGVRRQTMGISMAGVENIKLRGNQGSSQCQLIFIEFARHLWVKNVETYNVGGSNCNPSAHVEVRFSYGVEIRDSYTHSGSDHNSGRGYGILLNYWNSHHKIENNVLRDGRHGIVYQGGGAVDANLYNYLDNFYEGTNVSFLTGDCKVNHGAWPHMNLWEGNDCQNIRADFVHGNSGYHTLFRNWGRGKRTTSFTDSSRTGVIVGPYSRYYNLVGNVAGQTSWTTGSGLDDCAGSDPIPRGYSFGRHTNGSCTETSPTQQAFNTSFRCTNYDYVTDGITEGVSCAVTVPPSLYYTVKPAFFGNTPWPLFGNDVAGKTTITPAQQCFDSNQMPNCLVGTAVPRNVTVIIVGTGTVTSSPAGITCPGDCVEAYADGAVVTLTGVAGANFIFTGWSGGGCSGIGPCVMTLSADQTVTATFVAEGGGVVGADTATTTISPANTTHVINLPSGIVAGNLVVVYWGVSGNPIRTWPGGCWTPFAGNSNGSAVRMSIGYCQATGAMSTVTITTDTAQTSAAVARRYTGHADPAVRPPLGSTVATGTNTAPNTSNLAPTDGFARYLWISAVAYNADRVPTVPAGYGAAIEAAGSPSVVIAELLQTALSQDPGPYALDGAAIPWLGFTVGLTPADTVPPVPSISSVTGTIANSQSVVIDGVDFGATQGTGGVVITDQSTWPGGAGELVAQTETAWAATQITITIVQGSFITLSNKYLYVTTDAGATNPVGFTLVTDPGGGEPGPVTRPSITTRPAVTTRPATTTRPIVP